MSIRKFFSYLYDTVLKTVKIGDTSGANYTLFESDGTMIATGNATGFRDIPVNLVLKGVGSEPVLVALVGGIYALKFDTGKTVHFENVEAPHDWKQGSLIDFHIHFCNKSLETVECKVNWSVEFAMANRKETGAVRTILASPDAPTVFGSKTITGECVIPANTPAGTTFTCPIFTVPAASLTEYTIGCNLIGTLARITKTAGGNNPSGEIYVLNCGIHYEVERLGSKTMYSN